jgi:aryl-alcohol dehydrogenase
MGDRDPDKGEIMEVTAAVAEEVGGPFRLDQVTLGPPGAGEVLVEIVGVGLCHTDLAAKAGHLPFPLPGVLGHEGSGVVVEVGSDVTKVGRGDRVVLSFNSCGTCPHCAEAEPAYCLEFMSRNLAGVRPDGTSPLRRGGQVLGGEFFGQSSLATHAIAHERNVVKVDSSTDLRLLGPLGCGIQTGAGAVLNSLDCKAGSTLLITGGGSVGLAAVLAAVAREVGRIIVVEPHEERRKLALALGATHALDPAAGPVSDQVRAIVAGGADYAIDTTGVGDVVAQVFGCIAHRGAIGLLAVPADPEAAVSLSLIQAAVTGLTVTGIIEGDSNPDEFIPHLLELHREGRFPFEKLITTWPFSKINEAVEAQARGEAVKIVLVHE